MLIITANTQYMKYEIGGAPTCIGSQGSRKIKIMVKIISNIEEGW